MAGRHKRKTYHDNEDDDDDEDKVFYEDHDSRHLAVSKSRSTYTKETVTVMSTLTTTTTVATGNDGGQVDTNDDGLVDSDSDDNNDFFTRNIAMPPQQESASKRMPAPPRKVLLTAGGGGGRAPPNKRLQSTGHHGHDAASTEHEDAWLQLEMIANGLEEEEVVAVPTAQGQGQLERPSSVAQGTVATAAADGLPSHRKGSGGTSGSGSISRSGSGSSSSSSALNIRRAREPSKATQPALHNFDLDKPEHWGQQSAPMRRIASSQAASQKRKTASKRMSSAVEPSLFVPKPPVPNLQADQLVDVSFRPSWLRPQPAANSNAAARVRPAPAPVIRDDIEEGPRHEEKKRETSPVANRAPRHSVAQTGAHEESVGAVPAPRGFESPVAPRPERVAGSGPGSRSGGKTKVARAGTLRAKLQKVVRNVESDEAAIITVRAKAHRDLTDPRQRASTWVDASVVRVEREQPPFRVVLLYIHAVGHREDRDKRKASDQDQGDAITFLDRLHDGFEREEEQIPPKPAAGASSAAMGAPSGEAFMQEPVEGTLLRAFFKAVPSVTDEKSERGVHKGVSLRIYDPVVVRVPATPAERAAELLDAGRIMTCTQIYETYALPAVPLAAWEAIDSSS